MKKVLVTDGEQRAALATVRSLGLAGYEVHVCASRKASLAGASRYCVASHRVAQPLSDPTAFVTDVARLVATTGAEVLVPITEAALLAVLPQRDRFDCAIPFPAAESFDAICDKSRVLKVAAKYGVAVPRQTEIASPGELAGLRRDFDFPVVLKPSRSVVGDKGQRVRTGVGYAASYAEMQDALRRIPASAYPVLVQQQLKGPGLGISVLVWDGELVAAFAHRRIREKPPSGGVSVLRESIPLNRELVSRSLSILTEFDWQGLAMVEYKLDAATSVPYLMEINGRPWGSLQLAIDSGVDFPRLLVELALGLKAAPVKTYKVGVRSRWEWGDVDHLLASLLHPSRFAGFSARPRHARLTAVADFIRGFGQENRAEVFRRDDPGPILRETLDWFRRR
jgi:predicted ATP-grasp superfamily ATP-dependent carboligase